MRAVVVVRVSIEAAVVISTYIYKGSNSYKYIYL